MRIRTVTLNLLHGAPLPGARRARASLEARLDWTAEHLATEKPDVILLQEASSTARHGNTAAALAERLGMAHVYAPANPAPLWRAGGFAGRLVGSLHFDEGPAVLSRFPILTSQPHRLSGAFEIHERRIALEALLDGPAGRLRVFSVHLTARSRAGRCRQIAALIRAVQGGRHGDWPAIVGGDFNADEDELRLLTDVRGWIDSFRHLHPDVPGHTWGQLLAAAMATAGRRIDFLFSAPAGDAQWHPAHSRLVLDRSFPHARDGVLWASDHYGVLTDFEGPNIRQNRVP